MSIRERVFITGANRGIGLGIVREYLKRGGVRIFATYRDPQKANELIELAASHPDDLTVVPLELSDSSSIEESYKTVCKHIDGLDVLINNASARFPDEKELFGAVKADEFLYSLNVNAVAPFMIVQTYIELLKAGTHSRIVNVTTGRMVPVEYNLPYNYCISKAALNMITRYFAVNLAEFGIISIGMYPGWVQTEMGYSSGRKPPLTVEQSAQGIVEVVSNLSMKENEQFIAWDGSVMSRMYW